MGQAPRRRLRPRSVRARARRDGSNRARTAPRRSRRLVRSVTVGRTDGQLPEPIAPSETFRGSLIQDNLRPSAGPATPARRPRGMRITR